MELSNEHCVFDKLTFQIVNFENIKEAIRTQNEIFPDDDASLHMYIACNTDLFKQYSGLSVPVDNVNYYLAFSNGEIIGMTGLYTYAETGVPNECWLAWYGVRKQFRGQGYGHSILEWTIQKAATEGYDVLRLYTMKSYADAVKVYKKLRFISEPYVLEAKGFVVYSIALTDKPLELLNGRFMNFDAELELCKISDKRKKEIISKYDTSKEV